MKRFLTISLGLLVTAQGFASDVAVPPTAGSEVSVVAVPEPVVPATYQDLTSHLKAFRAAETAGNIEKARLELAYINAILGDKDGVEVVKATTQRTFRAPLRGAVVPAIVVNGRKSSNNVLDVETALFELGFTDYAQNSQSNLAVKAEFLKLVLTTFQSILADKGGMVVVKISDIQKLRDVLAAASASLSSIPSEAVQAYILSLSNLIAKSLPQVATTLWSRNWGKFTTVGVIGLAVLAGATKIEPVSPSL